MKYRMPFVFSYERFENALICIISRFRPILNFPIFLKNGASLELLNIVTVWPFGEIKKFEFFELHRHGAGFSIVTDKGS